MAQEPLVFLPGLLCDRRLFGPQIVAFRDYHEIHVPDLSRDNSMPAMAKRVLDSVPARFALCGLSMGGYLALEVTRQAPDRVTRLAILGSNARPDTEAQSQGRRDLMALTRRGEFHGVSDRLLPKLVHERRLTDQGLSDLIKSMALNIGKDGFIRQETALIDRVDARPWLPDIRCSTLVLCGRQDALRGPDYHEEMAALIPDATLVVIPDCGHLSTLEQPSMVNAQLRVWLAP